MAGKPDACFDPWESDHTALVHVLWDANRGGLGLVSGEDCDSVASMIRSSRYHAAVEAAATAHLRTAVTRAAADLARDDVDRRLIADGLRRVLGG